jgi:hypothetical protein
VDVAYRPTNNAISAIQSTVYYTAFLTIFSVCWRTGKQGSIARMDNQIIGVRVLVGENSNCAVTRAHGTGSKPTTTNSYLVLPLALPIYCDILVISRVFLNTSFLNIPLFDAARVCPYQGCTNYMVYLASSDITVMHGEVEQHLHQTVTAVFSVHLTQ